MVTGFGMHYVEMVLSFWMVEQQGCHLWAIFGAYCFCSGGSWSYSKCLCATRIFNVLDRQNSIMYGVMFLGFFSGFDFSIRVVS